MTVPNIRRIALSDNQAIEQLIRKVFDDMNVPKQGTTYEDKELTTMFESYEVSGAAYFVMEVGETIVGGAGISRLKNYAGNVCELQKMYFSTLARGKGWGNEMLTHCLESAVALGYSGCYLETMPYMKAAQHVYLKNGFVFLDSPMGRTGHNSCPVYMFKKF